MIGARLMRRLEIQLVMWAIELEPLGAAESCSAEVCPLTPVIISFVFSVVYIVVRRDNNSLTSFYLRPCSFVLSCRRFAQGRDGVVSRLPWCPNKPPKWLP